MRCIIAFLVCLNASAQLPVLPVPIPSSGLPGPKSIAGLSLYWNHADLIVGQNVSNWVDEIQGKLWTNINSSTWPTNAATGVCFNAGQVLTNDGSFLLTQASGSFTIWVVIKTVDNGHGSVQRAFLSQPNNSGQAGLGLYWFNQNFTSLSGSPTYFFGITNIYKDWIFQTDSNGHPWFTNNVATANGVNLQAGGNVIMFNMGRNPGVSDGMFFIAELGLYTVDLSSGNRTTLHNYAISKYGVNP